MDCNKQAKVIDGVSYRTE